MKIRKIIKIIVGVVIFFTLPSLLFFSFLYLKYNISLPDYSPSAKADSVAMQMLNTLNYKAYKEINYLEWTFKNRHHYQWKKNKGIVTVFWKDKKVELNLIDPQKSSVYINNELVKEASKKKKLIQKAQDYFNNDSFWLVAPYKVFDSGTKRSLVTLENGEKGLLVTYTKGGTTPGDSYLWLLDANKKPYAYRMWVDILPIDGLKATWSGWVTTKGGAMFSLNHQLGPLSIPITNFKTHN